MNGLTFLTVANARRKGWKRSEPDLGRLASFIESVLYHAILTPTRGLPSCRSDFSRGPFALPRERLLAPTGPLESCREKSPPRWPGKHVPLKAVKSHYSARANFKRMCRAEGCSTQKNIATHESSRNPFQHMSLCV